MSVKHVVVNISHSVVEVSVQQFGEPYGSFIFYKTFDF